MKPLECHHDPFCFSAAPPAAITRYSEVAIIRKANRIERKRERAVNNNYLKVNMAGKPAYREVIKEGIQDYPAAAGESI